MKNLFANVFAGKKVLVTGHTGFKGSWLTLWLIELGAEVIGFSLDTVTTTPNHFDLCGLGERIQDVRGDIQAYTAVAHTIHTYRPDIIFHLAAQPLVLRGVSEPKLTFDTNAGGTINVLEAIRHTDSVRVLVNVTTDKVYQNQEWLWGYREQDRLGGHDPYSASKAMAELAIHAYQHTFFPAARYATHGVAMASVRAGNVIGGGDFADFRLVPDCLKALMADEPIGVRNPLSVRPWQHVLEPLSGYLWLAAQLWRAGPAYGEAWNFGPLEQRGISTQEVAEKLIELWGNGRWLHTDPGYAKVETGLLRLSWEKAAARLGWRPVYTWEEALAEIVAWFKAYQSQQPMYPITQSHIAAYVTHAAALGLPWVGDGAN